MPVLGDQPVHAVFIRAPVIERVEAKWGTGVDFERYCPSSADNPAVRASFALDRHGRPVRIDHPGYGPGDAFYDGNGRASAINTCNQWLATRLRLAGIKAPLWSPFVEGLVWRYRAAGTETN